MNTNHIAAIKHLLQQPKTIVIVIHYNPDGDAIGAALGLYHYLINYQKEVVIIAPNDYPFFLKWMPHEDVIIKYSLNKEIADNWLKKADIIFTLDFNNFNRTGEMETILMQSKALKIMIDHHQQPDNYATYMFSDVTMSSTSQMVFHFIEALDDTSKIDKNIAISLYTGIMTDTGSFRFSNTTSLTHKVVASLIDCGIDNAAIHNAIYDTNSQKTLQLLGCALKNLTVLPEYNTAYITLSQQDLDLHDFKKGDTEGFVNYCLSIKDVIFGVIFIENQQEGIIKISFRSKGHFSVNEFARKNFNGGGHTHAAGGKSTLPLNTVIEKFITILPTYKTLLNS